MVARTHSTVALSFSLLLIFASCGSSKKSTLPAEGAKSEKSDSAKALVAKALSDRDKALPLNSMTREVVLDNGVRIFVRKNTHQIGRASFRLAVDAGSLNEDESQQGLAHFLEHMAFNGTEAFPKNVLISNLEKLGAAFGSHQNAYTSFDETVYKLTLPETSPEAVATTIKIMKEWASKILIAPDDVAAERGVVISEMRNRENVQSRLGKFLIKQVLHGTKYASRYPIGKLKVLETASPQKIRDFYEDWYQPKNMAVIAVGDFDVDKMTSELSSAFAGLKNAEVSPAEPERSLPADYKVESFEYIDKEIPVYQLAVARPKVVEEITTANEYDAHLREIVVFSMLALRLQDLIQRNETVCKSMSYQDSNLTRRISLEGFFAVAEKDSLQKCFEEMASEIERARRHGFIDAELKRIKENVLQGIRSSADDEKKGKEANIPLADELVRHFFTKELAPGRSVEAEIMRTMFDNIRLEDLPNAVDGFVKSPSRFVMLLGPQKAPGASVSDLESVFNTASKSELSPYSELSSVADLLPKRPTPGRVVKETYLPDLDAYEWTLSNGAKVYIKKTNFENDTVEFNASSPGGTGVLSLKKSKPVMFAGESIHGAGLGEFDWVDLGRVLAGKRVSVQTSINEGWESVSGTSSAADVETLLKLVHLAFTSPRSDPEFYKTWKERKIFALKSSKNSPQYRMNRKSQEFLEDANPRKYLLTEANLQKLNGNKSFKFYQDRFRDADDFIFTFVGDIDKEAIKPWVETYIASIESTKRRERVKIYPWAYRKKRRVHLKDGQDQKADVTIAYRKVLPRPITGKFADEHSYYFFLKALNKVLLGEIREKLGGSYGVSVGGGFDWAMKTARMTVSFSVDPSRIEEIEKVTLRAIDDLVKNGVSPEIFERVRATTIKSMQYQLVQNTSWITWLRKSVWRGYPLDYFKGLIKVVEGLSPKDIQDASRKFLDRSRPQIVISGPESVGKSAD